jgi:hypothetical protein
MIRGAIDELSINKIGGWIYSSEINLTGRPVLAFLEGRCVGAGLVDVYRADLAAAGLGEGLCGFSFFVSVPAPSDVRRLQIRLEGSDVMLVPPGARVAADDEVAAASPEALDPARLSWMRERGWLSQAEFDFLRYLDRLGAYDWRMPRGKEGSPDPRAAAQELFGLIVQKPVDVEASPLADEGALLDLVAAARQDQPFVALHAPRRARVLVTERSHRPGEAGSAEPVAYVVGPERLLVLHAGARFETEPQLFAEGTTGFRFRLAPA